MTPNPEPVWREYTEAELKPYRTEMGKRMTAADLMKYIDDDEPVIPAEEVLQKVDALLMPLGNPAVAKSCRVKTEVSQSA